MNSSWAKILVHHPFLVLSAVAVFSGTCIIIPLTLKNMKFPSFQDPQMGFSTRGTVISNRLMTWSNLIKAIKPAGDLISNPKEYLHHLNVKKNVSLQFSLKANRNGKGKKFKNKEPVYGNILLNNNKNMSATLIDVNRWKAVQSLTPSTVEYVSIKTDMFFCGNPDEKYAHLVVTALNKEDLFTLGNMLAMCRLEHKLTEQKHFNNLCVQNTHYEEQCCRPWSIPNYIAILNNKPSCLSITQEDVDRTRDILMSCANFFHNFDLETNCFESSLNCGAPVECIKHDAVFNVLHYLASTSFLPRNNTGEKPVLTEAMIFLPLACSTAMMPYFHEIENLDVSQEGLQIVAMDFGLKSALFDEYLRRDTWLMGLGAFFVFMCIWLYTESLFLTIMTIILIAFSLAIAYFTYVLVLEINFFPFMNLLATIVAIGIGSDDAFIFCKIWQMQKQEQGVMIKTMTYSFHHAFVTMFVTALTTSVAFLGSYVSSVTAVCCFSIFAGITVVANHLLMMTWFPACLVVWEKSCLSNSGLFQSCFLVCYQRWCCIKPQWNLSMTWFHCSFLSRMWKYKEEWLLDYIIKLKYVWFFSLLLLAIASGVVVLVYPKLQLPDSNEFQLFASSHPFEQYDFTYKKLFWFKRTDRMGDVSFKLPLRFVWGVLPIDNGNHLNPSDQGTLTFDPNFDISDPDSQKWLVSFCSNLREQEFYHSTFGPLLANCFIETFMTSMQRRCQDFFTGLNIEPCCEVSNFPFNRSVFTKCIIEEMDEVYKTPADLLNMGEAGPKFSKDQNATIKAVIIEYDSSYTYTMSYEAMHDFFTKVEGWMQEQLKTAPDSMKNGWFITELEFYDLQRELSVSTEVAVVISMGLALVVLFFATLNILTSVYAIITITSSIFVTMAVLVLLGWKLNILESMAVSIAIGLTVDFSLHYSVNYRLCPDSVENREDATRYALSYMAGPAFMAALTTAGAGAFMLCSVILPYIQIGIFLILVMCISWIYATFLLGSMLAIIGPDKKCGQLNYSNLFPCFRKPKRVQESVPSGPARSSGILDSHELESLTYQKRPTPKPLKRSLSSGDAQFNQNKDVFTDQSPSAASAITIIMADDN